MSNKSRPWVLIGLIGLLVIGGALIAWPLLTSALDSLAPTPVPTALIIDQAPYPSVPRISVEDAYAAWQAQQAIFVDVRSAGQYADAHISGAKSIPDSELEIRLNELNKDQWIITYCT
jgi:3-mercaptopyruvate sulfurtransferase SseA